MNIILGITGSISAYKTPWLVRDLVRAGHTVRVVMSASAAQFVAPLALESVSQHPVIADQFDPSIQDRGSWHVHLARWADAMIIAPCTASTLSRLATGMCDSAVMTVACSLPASTPLLIAPAMDTDMWQHPSVARNLERVQADGITVIPPEEGELASGLQGAGRLASLDTIVAAVTAAASSARTHTAQPRTTPQQHTVEGLAGKHVLITAGPTHEAIDDVRYLGNHSSGRMGFALAEAARDRGALVTLITGPVHLTTPTGIERVDVTSAAEMHRAVMQVPDYDVAICAAAVADFTPAEPVHGKIKKDGRTAMMVELVPTVDILAGLGAAKKPGQIVVGFALEHTDLIDYATRKLTSKQCHMIVANLAGAERSGFGTADNTITLVRHNQEPESFPAMSKQACAAIILDAVDELILHNGTRS